MIQSLTEEVRFRSALAFGLDDSAFFFYSMRGRPPTADDFLLFLQNAPPPLPEISSIRCSYLLFLDSQLS